MSSQCKPKAKKALEYCPAAATLPRWHLPVTSLCRRPIVTSSSCWSSELPRHHTRSRCRRLPCDTTVVVAAGEVYDNPDLLYLLLLPINSIYFIYVLLAVLLQSFPPGCLPEALDICSTPEHDCNCLPHQNPAHAVIHHCQPCRQFSSNCQPRTGPAHAPHNLPPQAGLCILRDLIPMAFWNQAVQCSPCYCCCCCIKTTGPEGVANHAPFALSRSSV